MRIVTSVFFWTFVAVSPADAGRIIVNHDEWTTSNTGFEQAGDDATTFVQNVAAFLNPDGGGGNFLVYSSDFSLDDEATSFRAALEAAGHTLTVSTAVSFDLQTLAAYDAIFLAGEPGADTTVLTDYVNTGGGVYLAGGAAFAVDATGEANAWNPFLHNFGLGFEGGAYNGIAGVLEVTGTHPILNGVADLYYNSGNSVVLFGANPNALIIESLGGTGLIGVYVPEPGSGMLLGAGLAVAAFMRRGRSGVA